MDSDHKFQCPRPRNSRACVHCRAKRTRCLRELPHSPCRRCQVLHLHCQFDSRTSLEKATCPAESKAEESDVLSGLFSASQKQPPSDNLVSFHDRIFQEKFSKTGDAPVDQPECIPDGSDMRPRLLGQKRADELVEKFRAKNNYFPFVTVPENNIVSPEHRFLYLALLAVSATDDMPLMRSLDARFRAVLAERVIVAGEKSLDYLQGLLVYIAWYNMHVRPTNLQIYQYLHIAISMVAELRFNDDSFPIADLPPSTLIEIKNACLGCFYLSSLFSTHSQRPNHAVLSDRLKCYLSELSRSEFPRGQMMWRCLKMQMDIEGTYRHEDPVQEMPRNEILDTPTINIANLFLAFFKKRIDVSAGPCTTAGLQSLVTAANEFFIYIVSLPANQLSNFSVAEWNRFILVIRDTLESLSAALTHPGLIPTVRECARQISIHLESLANCMAQGSQSGHNPGEFPDMLYLFKSVLDLLIPLEAKLGLPAEDESDPNLGSRMGPPFKSGQCPVLVGMRKTDFWSAYQNSPAAVPSYDLDIDFECLFGDGSGIELSDAEWMDAASNLNM